MIRPLCAQVEVYPDESLLSVIARSADANIVPTTAMLLKRANVDAATTAFVPFSRIGASAAIAALLGLPPQQVSRRMFSRCGDTTGAPIDWFGTSLERRFVEARLRRYSASALIAEPYGRSQWQIRPLLYCPQTFEFLQSTCQACHRELGWAKTSGFAFCEHCDAPLDCAQHNLPESQQNDYRDVADLVNIRSENRLASLKLLPPIFDGWVPGQVFATVVEFGAFAAYASSKADANFGQKLANGDFSPLGHTGLVNGWKIARNWPGAFDPIIQSILEKNRQNHTLKKILGPLDRICCSTNKSPIAGIIRGRVAILMRELDLIVKHIPQSNSLSKSRNTSMSTVEVKREFHIGNGVIKRLKIDGNCIIGRSRGTTGLHLFDRALLEQSVMLKNAGQTCSEVEKIIGAPAFVVAEMVEAGILREIDDCNVKILANELVISPDSTKSLCEKLSSLKSVNCGNGMTSIADALRSDLSPFVWADLFHAITSRIVDSHKGSDGENLSERILVQADEIRGYLRESRARPLPDINIAARVGGPIIGFSDVTLSYAISAGLISRNSNGIPLLELARFRASYVSPSEISEWFQGSGRRFANSMSFSGASPAATLNKVKIWRRSDVERVFGSQRSRNVW